MSPLGSYPVTNVRTPGSREITPFVHTSSIGACFSLTDKGSGRHRYHSPNLVLINRESYSRVTGNGSDDLIVALPKTPAYTPFERPQCLDSTARDCVGSFLLRNFRLNLSRFAAKFDLIAFSTSFIASSLTSYGVSNTHGLELSTAFLFR